MGVDELKALIAADELADAMEQRYIKPREYAKALGIAPQRVYAKIRQRKLELFDCPSGCGCRVIEVEKADEIFQPKEVDKSDVVVGDEEQE